ncbi:MAG: VanZ family protein [Erysipelotrichaceae bacterium]|nr:VanZ family protein [Erysipelotrichaceae bacterium]
MSRELEIYLYMRDGTVIIALILALAIYHFYQKSCLKRHDYERLRKFRNRVFIAYMIALCVITIMSRGGVVPNERMQLYLPLYFINAIKYRYINFGVHDSFLNLLLFIPFGYLFPHFKKSPDYKWRLFLRTVVVGFLVSLSIEIIQLVTYTGCFQLDDLLKNTMGAAVGCLIYLLLERKNQERPL